MEEIENTNTKQEDPVQQKDFSYKIGEMIGLLIIYGPLYYFLVWRLLLPGDFRDKLILTGVIVSIVILSYIFFRANTETAFKLASNYITVLTIVLGAALISIYFNNETQTLLFKLFIIGYFSFLPAWLYLQFISIKGKTLWNEYVLNLFRLEVDDYSNLPKPPEKSVFINKWNEETGGFESEDNIYRKKFEGLFGPVSSEKGMTFSIFRGENLWPVAISTLLISVGWVMVVEPETIFNISLIPSDFKLSETPVIPHEIFRFGFLGAYFYILQMLVRRYFQNDLKTSAYVNSIMRIIVVIFLVWTVDLILPGDIQQSQRMAFAFVIGVFPYLGWQTLQAMVKIPIKHVIPSLQQQYPLSDLDGLNIWYESRLLEEGIEDMQNLATSNLVDVMLNTRIPVERLVDWVDQSLLYLHLSKSNDDREILRRFGIRTATDLVDVIGYKNPDLISKIEYVMTKSKEEPILNSIYATLKNEPNLYHVKEWKSFAEKYLSEKIKNE